jgi:hypothetical protein
MTTVNAAKKLERLTGQKVTIDCNGLRSVIFNNYYIAFYNNGRDEEGSEAICFHTQRVNADHKSYWGNITQAFNFVNRK